MGSFFKKFIGVKADEVADNLVAMLVNWDPEGATEAEKRMIAEQLAQLTLKCEQARTKMNQEVADVARVKAEAAKKVKLVEGWQTELANPQLDPQRKTNIESRLPGLVAELTALGPEIDREVEEARIATELFQTYDKVVIATNEKLKRTAAKQKELVSKLEIAKAQEALADQQVDAARVLAGLSKAHDSMDVASKAIEGQTGKINDRIAAKKREAGLLTPAPEDDFVARELAKVEGHDPAPSIADQLAAMKAKL